MRITKLFNQTVHIGLRASRFFLTHPSLLIFPLISFLLCCMLEFMVLLLIYLRYGIHIFNPETIELWGFLSLWELGFLFALLTAPLYCAVTFCMLLAKAGLADALNCLYEDPDSYSWYKSFYKSFGLYRELMQFAYLKTLLIIVGESGAKKFLRRHVDLLGGRDYIYQARADNWLEATFLVVPLLVSDTMSLKNAVQESRRLMEKTFGEDVIAQFSFVMLIFIGALGVVSPVAHLIRAQTNGMVAIALFFLFVAGIMSLLRSLEGIFHAVVYRSCLKKSIEPFTKEDVVASFARESNEIV